MKKKFFVFVVALFSLIVVDNAYAEDSRLPFLTIYTTQSFASDWVGETHAIKNAFERQCNCKIDFVALDSGASLLTRLQFEGSNSKADLVVGLDMNQVAKARELGFFVKHEQNLKNINIPISWDDDIFIPYDYGYFSFIYDKTKLKNPPKTFRELVFERDDIKIIIQDPRSSIAGFGLLAWVKKVFGSESKKAWGSIMKKVVTITRSWSESYGLFMRSEADMILSYSTSPGYHIYHDNEHRYKAAIFPEGHYLEIEVMAKMKNAREPELASQFMKFAISYEFQKSIFLKNFMYPVIDIKKDLSEVFIKLQKPSKSLYYMPNEVHENRSNWLNEWLEARAKS